MDSGLGVQWPLSPFATAIATGAALFAVCVALWKQRNRKNHSAVISSDDSEKLEECCEAIQKNVLNLEVPKHIVHTIGFSSTFRNDGERSEVLTFVLPPIFKHQFGTLTLNLINSDDRLAKLNFGPFLKHKVRFPSIENLIRYREPDPRDNLRFGISAYSGRPLEIQRYPFCHQRLAGLSQQIVASSFQNFNLHENKLFTLDKKFTITRAAKNIILQSKICRYNENSFLRKRENIPLLLERNQNKPEKCDVTHFLKPPEEFVRNENKSDCLRKNSDTKEDSMNPDKFETANETINREIDINLEFSNQIYNKFENDNLNQMTATEVEVEDKPRWKIKYDSSNQNIKSKIEYKYHADLDNRNITELQNSESFRKPLISEYSRNIKLEWKSGPRSDKNEEHHSTPTSRTSVPNNIQQQCEGPGPRASGPVEAEKSINYSKTISQELKSMMENLEGVQEVGDKKGEVMTPRKDGELLFGLETKQTCTIRGEFNRSESSIGGKEERKKRCGGITTNDGDVMREREEGGSTSRSRAVDERARSVPRQMDRRTNEGSDADSACLFETRVVSETRIRENGDARVSAAVTSSLILNTSDYRNGTLKAVVSTNSKYSDFVCDAIPNRKPVSEGVYRPTYEEYMPDQSKSLEATIDELNEIANRPLHSSEPSSPRVSRLKALMSRDEERRARMKFFQEKSSSASIDGEWDRILRDVLASVSELERWKQDGEQQRRRCDVTQPKSREDAEKHHFDSSPRSMEGEETVISPTTKGETPTKVKNLRFKLDPDVFDVPSDDSFYDDDDDDIRRPGWRRQPKYRTFSTLEFNDEPVKLVSVHASVVPAGQKMVARPVGIDLRVRLTEERQSKRAHVGTSPSQVKRRSPVSDARVGWCQELSPVTENVDWRETFANVPKDTPDAKPVPNGILKTPSPKTEPVTQDSANPFKVEGELTNGNHVVLPKTVDKPLSNGVHWKPSERKLVPLPRKKFQPDPEAIDRITGYKLALTKPPLPPPLNQRVTPSSIRINRAEIARKQYLDSKAAISAKTDSNKKFQQFLAQAQSDRARIVTSVPDLGAIEKAVSEQWARERISQRASPAGDEVSKYSDTTSSRGSTPDDAWASYVQSCRKHLGRRSQSMTYLETDVDIMEDDDKWRSTSALLEPADNTESPPGDSDLDHSHEDLDDSGRAKSEHELRIQKSLQSLPLPAWYKQCEKPKSGFLLGSGSKEKRGWAAAKSLASSTSSLASCGLKRPIRSLRSSRENIPWSRGSPSPDGPALSLALARAFREPYLGWRARTSTTSSGVSSSPRTSPPSWSALTTDEEVNGVSFDGEDAFGRTSSQDDPHDDPPSQDDTGADAVTVSMDTGDLIKLPGGEDTCDDINNMSMDTCELFDISIVQDQTSPQADTGDDIDNLSTDTTEDKQRKDPKFKRYSYSQSIYHSEWDEESRGDRKSRDLSPDNKVIWIESSFVGSRTTTSIVVLPEEKRKRDESLERPASR